MEGFAPVAIDVSDWEKVVLELAKSMHEGKLKPEDLSDGLLTHTYNDLNEAAGSGYGSNWAKLGESGGIDPATLKARQNLFRFSGAKTYAQLVELNEKLTKDGQKVPWDEFRTEALKLNEKYNLNHLQAEHQTANIASHHMRNWEQFQKQKHLFPNLKFVTAGDSRVSDEHRKLEGIIAPIDSDFWKRNYPPLRFRCRCGARQTAEKATKDIPRDLYNVAAPEFRNNVGITSQVFSDGSGNESEPHPYFSLANNAPNRKKLAVSFEKAKSQAPYVEAYKGRNGGKVEISPFAHTQDLTTNIKTAVKVADGLKIDIRIRPHLDRNILPGKNPEYEIGGKLGDLKANFKPGNYNGIKNAFKAAKAQNLEVIVFDFTESFKTLDIAEVNRQVCSYINDKRGSYYKSVIFVYREKVVEVTNAEIVAKKLVDRLKKLTAEP